jgi:hypothetical protein
MDLTERPGGGILFRVIVLGVGTRHTPETSFAHLGWRQNKAPVCPMYHLVAEDCSLRLFLKNSRLLNSNLTGCPARWSSINHINLSGIRSVSFTTVQVFRGRCRMSQFPEQGNIAALLLAFARQCVFGY